MIIKGDLVLVPGGVHSVHGPEVEVRFVGGQAVFLPSKLFVATNGTSSDGHSYGVTGKTLHSLSALGIEFQNPSDMMVAARVLANIATNWRESKHNWGDTKHLTS